MRFNALTIRRQRPAYFMVHTNCSGCSISNQRRQIFITSTGKTLPRDLQSELTSEQSTNAKAQNIVQNKKLPICEEFDYLSKAQSIN